MFCHLKNDRKLVGTEKSQQLVELELIDIEIIFCLYFQALKKSMIYSDII